jgi:NAD(P)-dependent dehydrogenase (short-subunit alcohol dehydrogenase family)
MPRSFLITGATDGLGHQVARELAAQGAIVLAHGRDPDKLDRTVAELRDAGAAEVFGYLADYAELAQVRAMAQRIAAEHASVDVLVNNAGVATLERQTSADGYELDFAVNYLAHFLLTEELLKTLQAGERPRIVNVASIGQAQLDLDDLMLERSWDPARAYSQSKLAQILFTFELADRLGDGAHPTVTALHPATFMDTKMVRSIGQSPLNTVADGARAVLHLAVGEDTEGVTGAYFDGMERSEPDPQAADPDARRRLWGLSEKLVGA